MLGLVVMVLLKRWCIILSGGVGKGWLVRRLGMLVVVSVVLVKVMFFGVGVDDGWR